MQGSVKQVAELAKCLTPNGSFGRLVEIGHGSSSSRVARYTGIASRHHMHRRIQLTTLIRCPGVDG